MDEGLELSFGIACRQQHNSRHLRHHQLDCISNRRLIHRLPPNPHMGYLVIGSLARHIPHRTFRTSQENTNGPIGKKNSHGAELINLI
jgi:hypothetical protein